MKVICVKKSDKMSPITVGKIYDILEEFEPGYLLAPSYFISDNGDELLYLPTDKDLIPLDKWRDQQLNKIGI